MPVRPAGIDAVAAVLVFGGLFGLSQLAIGDFAITGSLPSKGPIVGVAVILYAASAALGILVRTGRGWLGALNLAAVFALIYFAAFGHAVPTVLGALHAGATLTLWRFRSWFRATDAWRAAQGSASTSR